VDFVVTSVDSLLNSYDSKKTKATEVGSSAEVETAGEVGSAAEIAEPRPAVIKPLAEDRDAIHFTASGAMQSRLRRLQELLRHQIPNGDLAQVIDRALIIALEEVEKTRLGKTTRPRPARQAGGPPGAKPDSRYIPAAVKRAVWKRDGSRCRFVGSNHKPCTETGRLQFHHLDPHGVGGQATIDNIELRCQAHNLYESEMFYGQRWIGRKQAREAARDRGGRKQPPGG
jgi:hypothetical protein